MSIFEAPPSNASWEELVDRMRRVREYIRDAPDPNERGQDGRSLLLLALPFSSTADGEELVATLLNRGADPNKPSAWAIFTTLLTASNSIRLVKKLIENGLQLDELYEVKEADQLSDGPTTLLDYAYGVRDYISPNWKKLDTLARKHTGGLSKRSQFIDETIAVLESHGAKRATDFV